MADVYKMKVWLGGLKDVIWRDIEVSSLSSVAKLGYTVMAAFSADGSHLFNIKFGDKTYEIVFDEDFCNNLEEDLPLDPTTTKLSALKLKVGDILTMEYDYGAGWEFYAELISISKMQSGMGTHYPYITDGMGKGIIEDVCLSDLEDIIKETDRSGICSKILTAFGENEMVWDYRDFNREFENALLKGSIMRLKHAYEYPEEWD